MPERDTYILHIYRGRAVNGWQWAARLDTLPGGDRRRFTDPEALLAHLRTTIRAVAQDAAPVEMAPGARSPPLTVAETGTQHADGEEHAGEEGAHR